MRCPCFGKQPEPICTPPDAPIYFPKWRRDCLVAGQGLSLYVYGGSPGHLRDCVDADVVWEYNIATMKWRRLNVVVEENLMNENKEKEETSGHWTQTWRKRAPSALNGCVVPAEDPDAPMFVFALTERYPRGPAMFRVCAQWDEQTEFESNNIVSHFVIEKMELLDTDGSLHSDVNNKSPFQFLRYTRAVSSPVAQLLCASAERFYFALDLAKFSAFREDGSIALRQQFSHKWRLYEIKKQNLQRQQHIPVRRQKEEQWHWKSLSPTVESVLAQQTLVEKSAYTNAFFWPATNSVCVISMEPATQHVESQKNSHTVIEVAVFEVASKSSKIITLDYDAALGLFKEDGDNDEASGSGNISKKHCCVFNRAENTVWQRHFEAEQGVLVANNKILEYAELLVATIVEDNSLLVLVKHPLLLNGSSGEEAHSGRGTFFCRLNLAQRRWSPCSGVLVRRSSSAAAAEDGDVFRDFATAAFLNGCVYLFGGNCSSPTSRRSMLLPAGEEDNNDDDDKKVFSFRLVPGTLRSLALAEHWRLAAIVVVNKHTAANDKTGRKDQ